jgi:hypothetical protein
MTVPDQLDLLPAKRVTKPSAAVDKRYLFGLPNLRRVIRYSISLRDLDAKQVYEPLGKDQAVWSRIESGSASFPAEQLPKLAEICDNHAPLMWLAYRAGYELTPLRSELEQRLEAEQVARAELERENDLLRKLITGRK